MTRQSRIVAVLAATIVSVALIAWYVVSWVVSFPPAVSASTSGGTASVTLQTVASFGHEPHPDWVSYLIKNDQGTWVHSTIIQVRAGLLEDQLSAPLVTADGASYGGVASVKTDDQSLWGNHAG